MTDLAVPPKTAGSVLPDAALVYHQHVLVVKVAEVAAILPRHALLVVTLHGAVL